MAQFSAALLRSSLRDLVAPARGRHTRRRSARVRHYAPAPAPAAPESGAPQAAAPPAPLPSRPRRVPPLREAAPVRPYYTAHERELAYAQSHPARRLRARAATPGPRRARVPTARRRAPYTPAHAAPAYPQLPAPRPAFTGDLLAAPLEPRPGESDAPPRLVRRRQDRRNRATAAA
ncbi:hypothetical protein [Nocardiopsis sp. CNT312]|uniref:hypothetical protein n=1 Tax=Nocardiopsis sp. CNT312 TaxID=1137268 RepID=UPI0004B8A1C3|nr:hypothetical protein [Nocardiopsis sp. CNT312]